MQVYQAPLRDMRFVLHELHADDGFGDVEQNEELTPDLLDAILEEAARVAQDILLPLNRTGDEEGCRLENGIVRTPRGFKQAYDQFRENGWCALPAPVEWGGQGLPDTVAKLVDEMICATNLSFSLYPGLTQGALSAMFEYASEELQQQYIPKMVDGTWSGTMCLTEAHCGTDLGLLRTRAVPQADGSYRITGGKIFISAGDHDLTENIVHLVLARLPDAPEGIKGISMFLVPKLLPDDAGNASKPNGVSVAAIEHKMGLKASATCQLNFEEATGWLVGEPHKGMQAMFRMMNTERVAVGVQGLGVGEAAYQSAVWYAKDRLQGRSLSGIKAPDKPADPIIVHPDVRRMLMTMRAYNEGSRALIGWVARAIEASEKSGEPEVRQRAEDFVALMTPVVKALCTDLGFESANLAVQVYGGHGYIAESGVEQFVRDGRIAMIYEGTNGIQALDLVGRKMGAHNGRYLRSFFHPTARLVEELKGHAELGKQGEALEKAFGALQLATGTIAQKGLADPEEAGAAASEYLRLLGFVAMGYCFGKAALLAHARLAAGSEEAEFYQAKLITARFFFDRLLPPASALLLAIKRGKASMMELPEASF